MGDYLERLDPLRNTLKCVKQAVRLSEGPPSDQLWPSFNEDDHIIGILKQ